MTTNAKRILAQANRSKALEFCQIVRRSEKRNDKFTADIAWANMVYYRAKNRFMGRSV